MKKRYGFLILLTILVFAVAMTGCRTNNPSDENHSKTAEPQTTKEPAATPEPSAEPSQEPESSEELKALLPEKEGYKWVYNGFAEYGHDLVLKEIRTENGKSVYKAEGEVFDMSDGESDRDYSLSVSFTVTPESIVQDKTGEMMMDTYDHIVLIQAPLKEGASWAQTVKNQDGTETTLDCVIEKVEEDKGSNVYTIAYQDKNSPYYEKRAIREGIGVINFTRLYITDEGSYEMSYSLYEEASGYGK